MNITPIEIRQKEFERHFRGYDKDEVNAFLHTLSQAWERLLQENREKTTRLEKAERDIDKVREVEGALFRTLRTAEDTSAGIVNKAQHEADEIQQQAERDRQEIIANAQRQAASIVEEAHQQVTRLKQEATEAEVHRQQVMAQLQTLAQGILTQIKDNASPIESDVNDTEDQYDMLGETTEGSANEKSLDQQESGGLVDPDEEGLRPQEEESTQQEGPAEIYEPVWATDDAAATPAPPPTTKTKRRSFFDEID